MSSKAGQPLVGTAVHHVSTLIGTCSVQKGGDLSQELRELEEAGASRASLAALPLDVSLVAWPCDTHLI
jgi:hypothetical protein